MTSNLCCCACNAALQAKIEGESAPKGTCTIEPRATVATVAHHKFLLHFASP